jgi:hypothetical protein
MWSDAKNLNSRFQTFAIIHDDMRFYIRRPNQEKGIATTVIG